jgi:hemoglobin
MSAAFRPIDQNDVATLVHVFYGDVRADPELGPLFENAIGDGWDAHLGRMVDFWSTVLLGARAYRGNVFGKHMELGLHVRPRHFLRWLTIWGRTTSRLFDGDSAAELQQIAQGVARNLYYGFFGDRVTFVAHGDEVVDTVLDAA